MWNKIEFNISQHFATIIEYGEYGDMSEDEIEQFDQWQYNEQDGKQGHWSIDEISEDYGKCEVTGLFSTLISVSWNYKE